MNIIMATERIQYVYSPAGVLLATVSHLYADAPQLPPPMQVSAEWGSYQRNALDPRMPGMYPPWQYWHSQVRCFPASAAPVICNM